MIRLKQLMPGAILWAVLLLTMLLLTLVFVDPSLSHSEREDLIEDGAILTCIGIPEGPVEIDLIPPL